MYIPRIEKMLLKHEDKVLEKFYHRDEVEWLKTYANQNTKAKKVASNFACKEAFSKAIKTGISGFKMSDISVLREHNGAPYITLYNNAKAIFEELGYTNLTVSISNEKDYATATVIVY